MRVLNIETKILGQEEGYVVSIITFFILIIMLGVTISMMSLIFYRQRISTNSVKSAQSYYTAEAGSEDALLLLRNNPQISATSYNLDVNGTTANVVIPVIVGSSRAITSQGNVGGIARKIQTIYSIDSQGVSFHYGAQVGAGGLQMSNSSRIIGNVFSNGNIIGSNSATIDNSVIVSGNGNKIDGMNVGGNVLSYSCLNSTINGNLTYVTGGTNTCSVGGTTSTQSNEITSQPLPISQSQIDGWKSEAAAGGTTGDVNLSGSQTMSLGPKKIMGNLSISNSAILTLTGTVYVTGNITISNSGKIKLDSAYGSLSGFILSDGTISPSNSSTLQGSGQAGSYLLVLSTSTSDSAITVGNSASGAIFYASAGGITVSNSFSAKEVTGYKLIMSNNSIIQYESGLQNVLFSAGPSGGWKITSWVEQ